MPARVGSGVTSSRLNYSRRHFVKSRMFRPLFAHVLAAVLASVQIAAPAAAVDMQMPQRETRTELVATAPHCHEQSVQAPNAGEIADQASQACPCCDSDCHCPTAFGSGAIAAMGLCSCAAFGRSIATAAEIDIAASSAHRARLLRPPSLSSV
ncbi:MAG: hypothetical protein ACT4PZ_11170 [Panacagrimonas sp.]